MALMASIRCNFASIAANSHVRTARSADVVLQYH